jgi:hypothetical protein
MYKITEIQSQNKRIEITLAKSSDGNIPSIGKLAEQLWKEKLT